MEIVGERDVWADEDAVFESNAFPEHTPILDGHVVADDGPRLYKTMIAYVAARANRGTGHDVRECPDAGAGADLLSFDERSWVHVYVSHGVDRRQESSR
jgi:hypothetical protein